jgi:hypothetical protein
MPIGKSHVCPTHLVVVSISCIDFSEEDFSLPRPYFPLDCLTPHRSIETFGLFHRYFLPVLTWSRFSVGVQSEVAIVADYSDHTIVVMLRVQKRLYLEV